MTSLTSRLLLTLCVIVITVIGCVTTGPGGKTSFVMISSAQEASIGAGIAAEVEQTEDILADAQWQSYINEIGQKIVAVCDRKDIEYHFAVIESDQINAFAAPGGYLYFYTGLLKQMDSEAELASVVAHEISHVVARHSMKQIQATLGVAMALELVNADSSSAVMQTAISLGLGLLSASYSREHEREADEYGVIYMTRAGYDPQGALDMFGKLAALGGGGRSNVFEQLASSHPRTQERISNVTSLISGMDLRGQSLVTNRNRYQSMVSRLR